MEFKLVTQREAIKSCSNLDIAYFMDIFPILIDNEERVVYAVGPNYTKGPRILGVNFWNEYSEEALINQVIISAQLSNNFKWFIGEMRKQLQTLKSPPAAGLHPLV